MSMHGTCLKYYMHIVSHNMTFAGRTCRMAGHALQDLLYGRAGWANKANENVDTSTDISCKPSVELSPITFNWNSSKHTKINYIEFK